MKSITILGSTGSIGTQALEVIGQHPDRFEVYALTAGNQADRLIEQARTFHPRGGGHRQRTTLYQGKKMPWPTCP